MKKLALVFCLSLGLGLLAVDASPSPAPPAQIVHMKNFAFTPAKVTVHVGETVEWINDDSAQHSTTENSKAWDSGELSQGQSWSHTFEKAGVYRYYCDDHAFMKAEVDVTT
ncbi:MAG: cupredoxin family copper-binding protein [Candidatus Baltobacteraceae bacterium]